MKLKCVKFEQVEINRRSIFFTQLTNCSLSLSLTAALRLVHITHDSSHSRTHSHALIHSLTFPSLARPPPGHTKLTQTTHGAHKVIKVPDEVSRRRHRTLTLSLTRKGHNRWPSLTSPLHAPNYTRIIHLTHHSHQQPRALADAVTRLQLAVHTAPSLRVSLSYLSACGSRIFLELF